VARGHGGNRCVGNVLGGILDMLVYLRYTILVLVWNVEPEDSISPQILSLYRISGTHADLRNILHCIFASNLCPMYQYSDIEILINTLLNP
jgi:hypothetical protein